MTSPSTRCSAAVRWWTTPTPSWRRGSPPTSSADAAAAGAGGVAGRRAGFRRRRRPARRLRRPADGAAGGPPGWLPALAAAARARPRPADARRPGRAAACQASLADRRGGTVTSQPQPFEYAVLRVVPRVDRGEAMNAGILLYCRPLRLPARPGRPGRRPAAGAGPGRRRRRRSSGRSPRSSAVCEPDPGRRARRDCQDIGRRFRWLTAPRSTVVQPGPGAHRPDQRSRRRGRAAARLLVRRPGWSAPADAGSRRCTAPDAEPRLAKLGRRNALAVSEVSSPLTAFPRRGG